MRPWLDVIVLWWALMIAGLILILSNGPAPELEELPAPREVAPDAPDAASSPPPRAPSETIYDDNEPALVLR